MNLDYLAKSSLRFKSIMTQLFQDGKGYLAIGGPGRKKLGAVKIAEIIALKNMAASITNVRQWDVATDRLPISGLIKPADCGRQRNN